MKIYYLLPATKCVKWSCTGANNRESNVVNLFPFNINTSSFGMPSKNPASSVSISVFLYVRQKRKINYVFINIFTLKPLQSKSIKIGRYYKFYLNLGSNE